MKEPLVSIIVPVYNAAINLARCIESIRHQKYTNIEIVVVNDGSKDSSMEIVNMYANVDKRIVAVDKENRGVSDTRNLGIQLAKGEYLQFVDSDDYLDENATRLMVEKIQECGADMVIAHYCHETTSKKTIHGFISSNELLDKQQFAIELLDEPASFYYGVMWNKLYRADIIKENKIQCDTELEWSEDFLFNLEYFRYAERIMPLKTPVYYYVYNSNSIVHTKVDLVGSVKNKTTLFKYYKDLYEELGLYEPYKTRIYKYLISVAEYL